MFQVVSPPIIRSSKTVHTTSGICQACLLSPLVVTASKLDDGRRNRLKHVEHWQKYRILYNVASCWLYLKKYINDARSHECQMNHRCSMCCLTVHCIAITVEIPVWNATFNIIWGHKHGVYLKMFRNTNYWYMLPVKLQEKHATYFLALRKVPTRYFDASLGPSQNIS